jgi:hypothetical protein
MSDFVYPTGRSGVEVYGMPIGDANQLVKEYLDNSKFGLRGRGGLVGARVGPDEPVADALRQAECTVFDEAFGNDAKEMAGICGPREASGTFFGVLDTRTDVVAGLMRVFRGSGLGLLSVSDAVDRIWNLERDEHTNEFPEGRREEYEEIRQRAWRAIKTMLDINDTDGQWDIWSAAIPLEYRARHNFADSLGVHAAIYGMFTYGARAADVKHSYTILDKKAGGVFGIMGVHFTDILRRQNPGPFYYLGSKNSYALYGSVDGLHARAEDTYRAFQNGDSGNEKRRAIATAVGSMLAAIRGESGNIAYETFVKH